MIRLAFFGTPELAVPFLDALAKDPDLEITAVVTMPDKPSGRGQKIIESPVKRLALERHLPILQPAKLKDTPTLEALRGLKVDIFVVVAYGKIIPPSVLSIPRLGCINVHPSLLPRWRGPSPRQAAIEAGERESGITIMLLDEGIDTGPILAAKIIPLASDETTASFTEKVCTAGPPLLVQTLKGYAAGRIKPKPQDDVNATLSRMLAREDGNVHWQESADVIERKFRAYWPWPGLWSEWTRRKKPLRLKWIGMKMSDQKNLPAGQVLADGKHLFIGTGSGALEILELQPEGKSSMSAEEFLRGYSDINGATLG